MNAHAYTKDLFYFLLLLLVDTSRLRLYSRLFCSPRAAYSAIVSHDIIITASWWRWHRYIDFHEARLKKIGLVRAIMVVSLGIDIDARFLHYIQRNIIYDTCAARVGLYVIRYLMLFRHTIFRFIFCLVIWFAFWRGVRAYRAYVDISLPQLIICQIRNVYLHFAGSRMSLLLQLPLRWMMIIAPSRARGQYINFMWYCVHRVMAWLAPVWTAQAAFNTQFRFYTSLCRCYWY